jgi:putative RNA 2'-phosphotransferase
MKDQLKRMSTFLSLILRHKPEVIGIKLDSEGWVDIDLLIQQSQQGKQPFGRKMIDEIVANNDKQRFVISDDKTKIRANQGHSLDIV